MLRDSLLQKLASLCVLILSVVAIARPASGQVTADQVREAIKRGVAYLKAQQNPVTGDWTQHVGQPGGVTALCTLALLNSGVDVNDTVVQRALENLRKLGNPQMTYSTSLQTMVLCAAEPQRDRLLISRNAGFLEKIQITSGDRKGAWAYSDHQGNGDNSNTQFALLALHEAERVGVSVSDETWRLALEYWLRIQLPDGAWGYFEGMPATGSMTCAGITSVIIAADRLYAGDAQVSGDHVQCCGQQKDMEPLRRALQWLGTYFSVHSNPSPLSAHGDAIGRMRLLYYLYGVERVGRMSGQRFIGRHDWYREGAEMLVREQDPLSGYWKGIGHAENNPHIATSLALLFLSKGRRPVLMAKLKHSEDTDWDLHRSGVRNLTRSVERRWKRDLTWHTIDARAATVDDLMETPVLFISGRAGLQLSAEQKETLRKYVNQGGFIFAEACCDGAGFDRDFRQLMAELFPDSPLRLLPPDHPVWYAEQKVDPKYMRSLLGVDACCRTSVIYCPGNLSCYWELSHGDRKTNYPAQVQQEVDACLAMGQNVLAYATNRQLEEKLRPKVSHSSKTTEALSRGVLTIPKLSHSGGADDAPNALTNLLRVAANQFELRVNTQHRLVAADDPELYQYPLLFMHGRRAFRLSTAQREALKAYLQRGGFLMADAICASPEFAESFRSEMKAMFPQQTMRRIPPEHPLFTSQLRGYDLSAVTLRDPQVRAAGDPLTVKLVKTTPLLEGLEIDGRIAVVFSPWDLSCALENHASLQCKGYIKEDAARIAINVLLFALQQ